MVCMCWSVNEDDNSRGLCVCVCVYTNKAGFKQREFGEKILSNVAQKVNCKSNGK